MTYLLIKGLISGRAVVGASEAAKRWPGLAP
jgi:hypothetical protein